MRILFLTMVKIETIETRSIYNDLLRKFREEGHEIYIVSPVQRREGKHTSLTMHNGVSNVRVRTLNLEKSTLFEKGIGQLLLERQYLTAIKKYYKKVSFDLVLYSTPPITFSRVIEYIKKKDAAFSYLLLKDIFPQNAVDMKMFSEGGVFHKFFLKKERKLYELSDVIGCMSPANRSFLLKHNPSITAKKVEVNPNTIAPLLKKQSPESKQAIRKKYGLPLDKKIFVYGGNLGVPQGVEFLLETIAEVQRKDAYFLVVGSGTKFDMVQKWFQQHVPVNAKLISFLPKADYDALLQSCDFGMIFLHPDFTIPNFPSRLLSYLEMEMPILAATDVHTDIGRIIEANGCGYWVESGDIAAQKQKIDALLEMDETALSEMKHLALSLLHDQYTVAVSYERIMNHFS